MKLRRSSPLSVPVLLITCLFWPAAWATGSELGTEGGDPETSRLLGHLQDLDEIVDRHQRSLAWQLSDEAEIAEEAGRLLDHLHSLEPRIRALAPPHSQTALRRLRDLLERAASFRTSEAAAVSEPPSVEAAPQAPKAAGAAPPADRGLPANDACTSAQAIGDGAHAGDTSSATRDGSSPSCTADQDVWFRYTASSTGTFSAYLTDDSTNELYLGVQTACPGIPGTDVDCGGRELAFEADAGSEVLIQVRSFDDYGHGPFTLVVGPASSIAGTVTDAGTGEPLQATVGAARGYELDGSDTTDEAGRYEIFLPRPDAYRVSTQGTPEHRDEIYDDSPCPYNDCSLASGDPILTSDGEAVTGIDFALDRWGAITGTITAAVTGEPLDSAFVEVFDQAGNNLSGVSADETGTYRIEDLDEGTYFVVVNDSGHQNELYDDIPCPGLSYDPDCDPTAGTPVEVDLNDTTTGIDFGLSALGGFSGKVTDAETGEPLAMVSIQVETAGGGFAGSATTADDGSYSIGGLDPGNYFARTAFAADYVDEIYGGSPCPRSCDPTIGVPIPVTLEAVTQGIDFELDFGGVVTGIVTDAVTGALLAGVDVGIISTEDFPSSSGTTDDEGRFTAGGLATGTYTARASRYGYLIELYGGTYCPDTFNCDLTSGDTFGVAVREVTSGVDFVLDRLGVISGSVTDQATGVPVSAIIEIWRQNDTLEDIEAVDFEGNYQVTELPPGGYYVVAESSTHRDEVYDGVPCPVDGSCDETTGMLVSVAANATVSGIDFELVGLGSISGTVREAATGEPVNGATVRIWDSTGAPRHTLHTHFDGVYAEHGLEPGTYFLTASDGSYVRELYDDLPCPVDDCDPTSGIPVTLTLGTAATGIDFELTRMGVISGSVRDSVTGTPLRFSSMRLWDAAGAEAGFASTDSAGSYSFEGLAPGTYFVGTRTSFDHEHYRDEIHSDLPCPDETCDPTDGTPVRADLDSIATVDFDLDLGQGIRGHVTHEETGVPLRSVYVNIWRGGDFPYVERELFTTDTGGYAASLPVGSYFVSTDTTFNRFDGTDEVFDGVPCSSNHNCDPSSGDPVLVFGGTVADGIDFALSGTLCTTAAFRLCLGDRFRIYASWEDFEGNGGGGRAEQLTGDTGYFWFFDEDNIEIVVKVLDACVEPFDSFWVFAAGLTNLAAEIVVTDTWTGELRSYESVLGSAFELVRDTAAFDTCAAGTGLRSPAAESAERARREVDLALRQLTTAAGPSLPAAAPELEAEGVGCVADETHLCLNQSRFAVEAIWSTDAETEDQGRAVPLTDDTGYFWFFGEDNVEVVVKVLDACGLEPFHNFWVFAAGLTDVEVSLRVTDTQTGEIREYLNPLGTPFDPIQDLEAFSECP